jgi:serine/threonine protein kinase
MMVTGHPPVHSDRDNKERSREIHDWRYQYVMNQGIQTDLIHYGVSAELRNLISGMLAMDFNHRPTIAEIRQHAWMTLNMDLPI